MTRPGRIVALAFCASILLAPSGCAWSGGHTEPSRSRAYYGGGSIHYNSFPRAYGYDGPFYVGRPY